MDGCVRAGSWLDLATPWELEEGVAELRPCPETIRRGTHFPGSGFAVFNASVLGIQAPESGVTLVLEGDFAGMDGTVLSIRGGDQALVLVMEIRNDSQALRLTFGSTAFPVARDSRKITLAFRGRSLHVWPGREPLERHEVVSQSPDVDHRIWTEGRLAVGGLLGEGRDAPGSNFLVGCLEKVLVQGKQLDMDLSAKDAAVSSYSCPVRQTERAGGPDAL